MKYILKGIVHPERASLTIGPIRPMKVVHIGTQKEIDIELNIVPNQITMWISTEEDWNPYDLRNTARNFATTVCSVLSFIYGYYYEVEIIQILSREAGLDLVFGIDTPCISKRAAVEHFREIFPSVLSRTGGPYGIYLSRCFKDLALALKDTEDTAFYCYRAIESLRKLVGEKYRLSNDHEQWRKLWDVTGLERGCISRINEHANGSRHGGYVNANEADRIEFLTKTWTIVEKFVENESLERAEGGVGERIHDPGSSSAK